MIVFENPGEIDIRSISTFGVSVKESDNPIGFFGTGLKYAIAVLLRTGHGITIHSGATVVEFSKRAEVVRGQEFDFVMMSLNGAEPFPMGFTTELGKTWELWMAYREIACNCKDEAGSASRTNDDFSPIAGITRVFVTGDAFADVHSNRRDYLLEDESDFVLPGLEVRRRPSTAFFYRGVRVMNLQRPSLYTFNQTATLELTEDRTVKNSWSVQHRIANALLECENEPFLYSILTAPSDSFEGHIDFDWGGITPGSAFMKVMRECVADRVTKLNVSALKKFNEHCKDLIQPREIELTRVQQMTMEKALDFCGRIGFQIRDAYPIRVVESLGEGCLGLAKDQTIYIAERVFHLGGTKQLASTLIEEYLHLRQGWHDLTRELQSFLFDKVVSLGEELTGQPL
ncbi:hypothetical protein [Dyella mobilis]|uniref:Histidine kinase-, DNA gyrase B-, and HSP90-like ATPase n=1 Tax=Dyella mobilis TaxID=1849582 RepID=A0ABS2KL20_9GAMM|nr:hypothetical protein [Dyella mobilis]MBM7131593.1 hypothetical protein [Dyella mobilis]GLQ96432.1 hypothetical protein GCM10007863_08500 [Dyella mobilis]